VKLVVSRAALADMRRLHAFLAGKDALAAARVLAVLNAAMRSLDTFPDRGRPSGTAGARDLIVPFGRSGYVLRYMHLPEADEVVVLRIWHGREKRE
jgi:plasmid stabilization system protein ParE